jgi:2-polyprenyl-6-methoxyphenol hydroxylase-like FAD-dependent oxidoreductase
MVDSDCVVVGGGPGGMVLAHLLARAGIRVSLLEGHSDFDRDFRGDSLHPYTLELLDQLGLAAPLLELPHFKAIRFRAHTPVGVITLADYGRVKSRFPYVALMPQARFLDFLAARSRELPTFTVQTGARVRELIMDGDRTVGVRWRGPDGPVDLTARVVVAADGRFSRLRTVAGGPVIDLGASSDLLWFRLPRRDEDPPEADVDLYFGERNYVALLGGISDWQLGYTLPKGGFAAAREAGVEPIRTFLRRHVGWLGDARPGRSGHGGAPGTPGAGVRPAAASRATAQDRDRDSRGSRARGTEQLLRPPPAAPGRHPVRCGSGGRQPVLTAPRGGVPRHRRQIREP